MANPTWDTTEEVEASGPTQAVGPIPTWDSTVDLQGEFGGTKNELLAGAAGAARGVSFGTSDLLLTESGLVNPETLAGLKEANPVASTVGEIAGVAAPLVATGGLGALGLGVRGAAKLGLAAERGAAALLPKASGVIGRVLSKGAAKGIGFGAEGALYGVGQSISESALGDHDLLSQKTLSNVGLSALYSGGIGSILGGISGRKAAQVVETIADASSAEQKRAISEIASDAVPGSEAWIISKTALPASEKLGYFEKLSKRVKNADQITKEFTDAGLPTVIGQLSDHPDGKKLASALSQVADETGASVREAVDMGYKTIDEGLSNIFEANAGRDPAEAGKMLKDQITSYRDKLYEPFKALYGDKEAQAKALSIGEKDLLKLHEDVSKSVREVAKYKGSPGEKAVNQFLDVILDQKNATLDTLDGIASSVKSSAREAFQNGNHEVGKSLGNLVEHIENFGDDLIEKNARAINKDAPEIAEQFIKARKELNKSYKSFKSDMAELASDLKLGKKARQGLSALDETIGNIPDEKFLDKIFDPRNAEALKRLKQKFPEVFETLAQQQKAKLYRLETLKKGFNPRVLMDSITHEKKMSKGVTELLFKPEDLQKIETYKKWINMLPDKVGPSGTPEGLEWMKKAKNLALDLGPASLALATGSPLPLALYLAKNQFSKLSTKMAKGLLEGSPETQNLINTIVGLERSAAKTNNRISQGINAILNVGPRLSSLVASGASQIADNEDYEKKTKQIQEYASNPDSLIKKVSKDTEQMYKYAPNATSALQTNMMNGIAFLNSKIPIQPDVGPFDKKPVMSKTQIARFSRYFETVNQPLSVLKHLKDGTLTSEHLEALTAVYPKLYDHMKKETYDKISGIKDPISIPYSTKISLSKFLGAPLHASLRTNGIMANQNAFMSFSQQQKVSKTGMQDLSLGQRTKLGRSDD